MNTRQIATTLLNNRSKLTPVLMTAQLKDQLGAEAFSEALRKRWIDIGEDNYAVISKNQAKLEEMQAAANSDAAQIGDEVVVAENGKTFKATVSKQNPDGTLGLTFGNEKPATVKPSWQANEVRVMKTLKPEEQDGSYTPDRDRPGMPPRPALTQPQVSP